MEAVFLGNLSHQQINQIHVFWVTGSGGGGEDGNGVGAGVGSGVSTGNVVTAGTIFSVGSGEKKPVVVDGMIVKENFGISLYFVLKVVERIPV